MPVHQSKFLNCNAECVGGKVLAGASPVLVSHFICWLVHALNSVGQSQSQAVLCVLSIHVCKTPLGQETCRKLLVPCGNNPFEADKKIAQTNGALIAKCSGTTRNLFLSWFTQSAFWVFKCSQTSDFLAPLCDLSANLCFRTVLPISKKMWVKQLKMSGSWCETELQSSNFVNPNFTQFVQSNAEREGIIKTGFSIPNVVRLSSFWSVIWALHCPICFQCCAVD